MEKNLGLYDRLFRFILAILLLAYGIYAKSFIAIGCSLFVFYESFASWCLFYQLIGKNSCPINKDKK